jgi:hypothetical protein
VWISHSRGQRGPASTSWVVVSDLADAACIVEWHLEAGHRGLTVETERQAALSFDDLVRLICERRANTDRRLADERATLGVDNPANSSATLLASSQKR